MKHSLFKTFITFTNLLALRIFVMIFFSLLKNIFHLLILYYEGIMQLEINLPCN